MKQMINVLFILVGLFSFNQTDFLFPKDFEYFANTTFVVCLSGYIAWSIHLIVGEFSEINELKKLKEQPVVEAKPTRVRKKRCRVINKIKSI